MEKDADIKCYKLARCDFLSLDLIKKSFDLGP